MRVSSSPPPLVPVSAPPPLPPGERRFGGPAAGEERGADATAGEGPVAGEEEVGERRLGTGPQAADRRTSTLFPTSPFPRSTSRPKVPSYADAPVIEQAIYRVVQEALHNVAKHSQAKNVAVQVTREDKMIQVVVEDDGIGIQPRSNSRGHSFGLAGIKERIAALGGVVRVVSAQGSGTRIEITVPAGEPLEVLESPVAQAAAQSASRVN